MPLPSHRVELVFVPDSLTREPDAEAFAVVQAQWRAAGLLDGGGLVIGGFGRVWLDRPGRLTLYANQQGGYHVRCGVTGGNLARLFSAAVQRWREGAARELRCPHCGQRHPLEEVVLSPPGAFARGGVVFTDVGGLELAAGVGAALERVLGDWREVIRRVH